MANFDVLNWNIKRKKKKIQVYPTNTGSSHCLQSSIKAFPCTLPAILNGIVVVQLPLPFQLLYLCRLDNTCLGLHFFPFSPFPFQFGVHTYLTSSTFFYVNINIMLYHLLSMKLCKHFYIFFFFNMILLITFPHTSFNVYMYM